MPVTAIAYDPDNELLLTGTEKGVIAVWNMHGGM